MLVGDTDRGIEIHLCSFEDWLPLIDRTEETVNPNDVFDAFCVFNYLIVRFMRRNDSFLDETRHLIEEYQTWLMKNNFWLHIRHIRNVTISPQLVVIGKCLARREFR